MIELSKQTMCVGEQSLVAFSPAYCESDIIVPDVKPDIVKVLQCDATSVISGRSCSSNRVAVDGKVNITVLYLGEDNTVHSLTTVEKLSHLIDMAGVNEGMTAEVEIDVENIECTEINSRRLLVKVLMGVDANTYASVDAELCCDIPDDLPFERLYRTVRPFVSVMRSNDQITVKDRLMVPSGKPSIGNILRLDSKISSKEYSIISNKVVIKGMLCIKTLYLGDMSDSNIQYMEHEIPFTEVLDAEGAEDNMTLDVKLSIESTYYDVMEDTDGDMRNLSIESIIQVFVKVNNETELSIIEDAYSLEKPYNMSHNTTSVQKLVSEAKAHIPLKDVASMPAEYPEIMQIFNVDARPIIGTTKIEDGKVIIEGIIDANILYLSADNTSPINSYKHEYNFTQQMEMENVTDDMLCDISIDIEHISYNISMGREVELRFNLAVGIKVICSEDITYLSDVEKSDEEYEAKKGCSIKVYFVKKSDTLWSIAKQYKTTRESIMAANGILGDSDLMPGKQIIIA